jgi:site-specific recombinase XerD
MIQSIIPLKTELVEYASREELLAAFLNTLNSPATRRAYKRSVREAFDDLGDVAAWSPVALTEHKAKWTARLDDQRDDCLSPSAVSLHLSAVRSFLRFCRITGQTRLTKEMIDFTLKSPSAEVIKPYQVLTSKERSKLVGVARENMRDRVLLEFAFGTGLRAAEICAVQLRDLTTDSDGDLLLRVRMGKGRKDRLVPVSKDLGAILRSYLTARELRLGDASTATEYLFSSRKGHGHGRLSTARLRQLMAQYIAASGIEKTISPHSARHTAAISWLRGGASAPEVQKILGHANLATTQKYVDHLELAELKDVVNHQE